jgi:hypothetical protein
MAFDVASVKQNISHEPPHNNVGLAGLDEGPPSKRDCLGSNTTLPDYELRCNPTSFAAKNQ